MAHKKRISMPRKWPIAKKGKTFIAKPHGPHKVEDSLPLLVVMRDLLQLVGSSREAKKVVKDGNIMINNRVVRDERFGVGIFDRISIPKMDNYYELVVRKKLEVREINKEEAHKKISRVIGKKTLNKNKTQVNLFGGINVVISKDMKVKVGDSIVLDLSNFSIKKILPLEKGARVAVIGGRHMGKEGKIIEMEEKKEGKKIKNVAIETKDGKINVLKKNLLIIE